ncbi:hypothetical protein BURMUCGD2M_3563 [Burkholderia multivorans CGD2M]|jgi:hypothetical protein|uniref:Uncharacterized protein n=1 Tax=Burkholderia multivorans CGD2 TaxID=513052 RepID=B9BYL6_9BURK|nr:hypothetical protein BURMUCGD2_3573 [Burkholderia multivorans CGD2]EEE11604.1 hypothetical protein BURMUCGD2M_3563 [Burkholderia multivorans CGD2M]
MFPAVEEWGVAQAGANARRALADVVFYGPLRGTRHEGRIYALRIST